MISYLKQCKKDTSQKVYICIYVVPVFKTFPNDTSNDLTLKNTKFEKISKDG